MEKNKKINSFFDHFPPKVAEYCFQLWHDYPFDFIIQPPHPQKDDLKLTIIPSDAKVKTVLIYDASGRIVYSSTNPNFNNPINISNLSSGVYMIKLVEANTNKIRTKKFIKE